MSQPLPPFACSYSPNVPELLNDLNISLAVSTYQAGKLIFFSAPTKDKVVQLARNYRTAMGIALNGNKMAIAYHGHILILANSPKMAPNYPPKKDTYDALYLPRALYYTGFVNMHDIEWASNGKLYGVATRFACIAEIDDEFSFKPIWKPKFISELVPEDRCHLNGMAMVNGKPKYATALGMTDVYHGWRDVKFTGGCLIDMENDEIILDGLAMPHSPRIFNDKLYLLQSAAGELIEVDVKNKSYEKVAYLKGFVRGMDIYGDYLFVGISAMRHKNENEFDDLVIRKETTKPGVLIVYLPYKQVIGHISYENSVEEIYDIKVLEGTNRPCVLNTEKEAANMALTIPEGDYWAKSEENY